MNKIIVTFLVTLCFTTAFSQWNPTSSTEFITTSHVNGANDFGLNLESSGSNAELFIRNNVAGVNQQAFYFGHANTTMNIFGISTSANTGSTWTPRFSINQNGYVGVGTNSPQFLFDVNGGARAGSTSQSPLYTDHFVVNSDGGTAFEGGQLFTNKNDDVSYAIKFTSAYANSTDPHLKIGVVAQNAPNIFTKDYMYFKGGAIGINTIPNTNYKFDVNGIFRSRDKIIIPIANATDGGSPALTVYDNQDFLLDGLYINHYAFGFRTYNDGGGNGTNAYMSGYYGMDFFTSGQSRIRVNRNGKVGIGTMEPDEALTVKGTVHSHEVRVDTDPEVVPDYVFEEDYDLLSVKQTELFIKENKHLPDVPSATELGEKGMNLKEMNLILLKKIEELTLHLINQNKLIEDQQKSLAEQKELLDEQNKRITTLEQK